MSNVGDPASFAEVVTPSDSTYLAQTALALYIESQAMCLFKHCWERLVILKMYLLESCR